MLRLLVMILEVMNIDDVDAAEGEDDVAGGGGGGDTVDAANDDASHAVAIATMVVFGLWLAVPVAMAFMILASTSVFDCCMLSYLSLRLSLSLSRSRSLPRSCLESFLNSTSRPRLSGKSGKELQRLLIGSAMIRW